MRIPVRIQWRSVALSDAHKAELFGTDSLIPLSELDHHGQVVYQETVKVEGKGGAFDSVHIIGPAHEETRVLLSPTDAHALGVKAPVRLLDDLGYSGTVNLIGPQGTVRATHTAIIPVRHLCLRPEQAQELGVEHHDVVNVKISDRTDIIETVAIRIHPTFKPSFVITTDEASVYWLTEHDTVQIVV